MKTNNRTDGTDGTATTRNVGEGDAAESYLVVFQGPNDDHPRAGLYPTDRIEPGRDWSRGQPATNNSDAILAREESQDQNDQARILLAIAATRIFEQEHPKNTHFPPELQMWCVDFRDVIDECEAVVIADGEIGLYAAAVDKVKRQIENLGIIDRTSLPTGTPDEPVGDQAFDIEKLETYGREIAPDYPLYGELINHVHKDRDVTVLAEIGSNAEGLLSTRNPGTADHWQLPPETAAILYWAANGESGLNMLNENETASLREQAMPRLLEEWRKYYQENEPGRQEGPPGMGAVQGTRAAQTLEPTRNGKKTMITVEREFNGMHDRNVYDNQLPTTGYASVATANDSRAYGHWANPEKHTIVAFVEGDSTTTTCENDGEFAAELRRMREWHQENDEWIGIDTTQDALLARFTKQGMADLLVGAG